MENAAHFLPFVEQKIFVAGRSGVCVQRESARLETQQRSAPLRASDPPSWENSEAQHREVLTIPLDPPGDESDVTENGKRRQCASATFKKTFRALKASDCAPGKAGCKKTSNNALARGVSCGRLASFAAPLL